MLSTNRILEMLRVSLHVLVAVLLAVGLAGQVRDGAPLAALLLAACFAAVYLAGTVWHNRGKAYPAWAPYVWLAVVAVLWVGLAVLSEAFVWLEFPLVMLACVILPVRWELPVTAALLAVTLSVTAPGGGPGAVVGPTIGTVLAVFIVHAYQALRAEADHYRQMAEDLRAAQREAAHAEHAAGVAQERARLAREVHDTMAQGLSSIVLLGRAMDKQLGEGDPARETLGVIRATASSPRTPPTPPRWRGPHSRHRSARRCPRGWSAWPAKPRTGSARWARRSRCVCTPWTCRNPPHRSRSASCARA